MNRRLGQRRVVVSLGRSAVTEPKAALIADLSACFPTAVACFMDDFEVCIAYLRLPISHRWGTRMTNLLERLFVEERRRLQIIPNAFGE